MQVMGLWVLLTDSKEEKLEALRSVKRRCEELGYKYPSPIYTDNCCGDAPMLSEVWPDLAGSHSCAGAGRQFPLLELGDKDFLYMAEYGSANDALANAFHGERKPSHIGLDLEWVPKHMQNAAAVGNTNSGKVCHV